MPDEATMKWAKQDSGETIFVDCDPATIASAYAAVGDLHARLDDDRTSIEPLLELAG
jgi:hypothetical protein